MDRKNINTTKVTLQLDYSRSEFADITTIASYHASNTIEVKIHPPDIASKMMALIVSVGGDAIQTSLISYTLSGTTRQW